MASSGAGPGWPSGRLPVELFMNVAQNLPREDLKSMRLVNREFNTKMMCYFLRQVVINFGPELSMTLDSGEDPGHSSHSIDVTERLMDSDVFRNFGPDIYRLGLAFELDERDLATPSTGDLEEVHIRHWGVYRWPSQQTDNQYQSHLDNVTMSLENSQGIFRLLSTVKNVQELALSCDGGLGYLQGPDVNPLQPPGRPPIFGDPNAVRTTPDDSIKVIFDKPYKLEMLERKLVAAGIDSAELPTVLYELLKQECVGLDELVYEERTRASLRRNRHGQDVTRRKAFDDSIRLQPDQLTETQMRFLYQHVTAQQALVNSFLIAVIDNGPSYAHLTKVNIARLPSFHVDILCRNEFWASLPGLDEVALGVIPDWREVSMKDKYTAEVRQVHPSDAIPKVFNLLHNYIGKVSRIKRLHFEWLCGGELAAGCIQRLSYVLPAPFLKAHRRVIDSSMNNLLILPFIKHLSLKNCWFAPNVFYRLTHTMALVGSLESLELETVSLSGPPIIRGPMDDIEANAGGPPKGLPKPPSYEGDGGKPVLKKYAIPELSWPHIIDMLTPGETMIERIYAENAKFDGDLIRIRKDLKLRKLVFKSCGYVDIRDHRFISTRRFHPPGWPGFITGVESDNLAEHSAKRWQLQQFLQVSTDRHLGKITKLLRDSEGDALRKYWGFRTGWAGVYDQSILAAAEADFIYNAGLGRFSGTIEHDANPCGEEGSDRSLVPYEFDTSPFEQGYDDRVGLRYLMQDIEFEMGYSTPFGSILRGFMTPW
ncbi:hypothetical protein F4804DRAFT_350602 [Jackrogersella minutella]|nr:hypothetical protein F4804DRAFT_350602 [Jackrogersella minutella]